MRITITKVRDVLTPDLRHRIKTAANPKKALEAMGLTVVSMAKRSFGQPSLRPASWPALKPATEWPARRWAGNHRLFSKENGPHSTRMPG